MGLILVAVMAFFPVHTLLDTSVTLPWSSIHGQWETNRQGEVRENSEQGEL